jgi:hypothetical protein
MSLYSAANDWLSLSRNQTNLVLVAMLTTLMQIAVFTLVLKQTRVSWMLMGYIFIVFVYQVAYYRIFLNN